MNLWMYVFLVLPLLGSAYVFWRLWAMLPVALVWKSCLIGGLSVGLIAAFGLFIYLRNENNLTLFSWAYNVSTSWLIILLYLVMTFLVLDLGRFLKLVPASFMVNSVVGTLSVLAFITMLFVYAHLRYKNKVRQELTLTTEKKLDQPLKLVLMSDLHLGYHNGRKELARWVDMVNAEQADAILIAGDIIDISVKPLLHEDMAAEMRRLNAPVYACLGNHEYISGDNSAKSFFQAAGIRLLRDEVDTIKGINIVGRDDRMNKGRKQLARVMQEVDTNKYTILLDHQPYHLEEAEQAGVDFQFSGHTHQGQVWPISLIVDNMYENAYGSSQRGKTHYYVSSGMGIWGGKFRIGTVSEYVVAKVR